MTKTYELQKKMIMADVDEKHHTATVSVFALDELVEAVNKTVIGNDVLDKIRAEIEQFADAYCSGDDINIYDVFQIIDKYKAESEETDADSN